MRWYFSRYQFFVVLTNQVHIDMNITHHVFNRVAFVDVVDVCFAALINIHHKSPDGKLAQMQRQQREQARKPYNDASGSDAKENSAGEGRTASDAQSDSADMDRDKQDNVAAPATLMAGGDSGVHDDENDGGGEKPDYVQIPEMKRERVFFGIPVIAMSPFQMHNAFSQNTPVPGGVAGGSRLGGGRTGPGVQGVSVP